MKGDSRQEIEDDEHDVTRPSTVRPSIEVTAISLVNLCQVTQHK